ncbi:glycosyltransferase [Flavobacteriaceae bacterium AU392]|nr:glycosyltransferase [Flavobacteriaceae bacterium]RKM82834.1 glycosyltransferase [Flavobacteriaceae bacterium AU392]
MNFLIISHVKHKFNGSTYAAYAPYVREMNLWFKYVDTITIVAPEIMGKPSAIEMNYKHKDIKLNKIPSIQFTSIKHVFRSMFQLPIIAFTIFKACKQAEHIHLRCPGNIGLIGCFVQILFPKKIKTAKYAGNWDPRAKQPKSYRLQKWLLRNTVLTKNMQVLVYGDWKNQTRNIKSFFTATFTKTEIEKLIERDYTNTLQFVFVGSLVEGKRPLLAIKIIEELVKQGKKVRLNLFGDGVLKTELHDYIINNNLNKYITLYGNQEKDTIKETLKKAHFLILPSRSEGWPKAIAEAMFFGVIPIATKISCVPYMLDNENRGVFIEPDLNLAVEKIDEVISKSDLKQISFNASKWSQRYTLDVFEDEIKVLLKK